VTNLRAKFDVSSSSRFRDMDTDPTERIATPRHAWPHSRVVMRPEHRQDRDRTAQDQD